MYIYGGDIKLILDLHAIPTIQIPNELSTEQ